MIVFHLLAKMNEEKVKMKLDIAGESFILSVPYSQQEETRQTESEVNMLYSTWRHRFPEKGDRELLAMIAFRYADHYTALRKEKETSKDEIDSLNRMLDALTAESMEQAI